VKRLGFPVGSEAGGNNNNTKTTGKKRPLTEISNPLVSETDSKKKQRLDRFKTAPNPNPISDTTNGNDS